MNHQPDSDASVALHTPEEQHMYETLKSNAPGYASAFLEQLPRARSVVLHRLLAALWREDVAEIRTAGRRLEPGDQSGLATLLTEFRPGTWLVREFCDELGATPLLAFPIRAEHAFHNIKPGGPVLCLRTAEASVIESPRDLVALLAEFAPAPGWRTFAAELAN